MVSPRVTLLLVLIAASLLPLPAEARRKAGGRCGLSCYRSAPKQFLKLQRISHVSFLCLSGIFARIWNVTLFIAPSKDLLKTINLIPDGKNAKVFSLSLRPGTVRPGLLVFVTTLNSIKSFFLTLHCSLHTAGRAREGPRASWYLASARTRPPSANVR